jgi:ABC-type glycerol-3-phosphate transport system substrate-binding protein
MRKPTKWVALLLAFMMMSALFVGCAKSDVSESASTSSGASSQVSSGEASTSTETEPEKPEKLTIWIQKTFSDDFNNAYAALFEEFGEQNGIEVDAQVIDAAALRDTKLPAALESGDMPNISYMEPASLVAYAKQGIIVSAQELLILTTWLSPSSGAMVARS